MRADVAQAAGGPGLPGVGPPGRLLLSLRIDGQAQPALWVFHDDLADLAEFTLPDPGARFLDHGVARVVMGEREDLAAPVDHLLKGKSFRQIEGQRLVANDVEARFQERGGRRDVEPVRCHHRHEIKPFLRGALGFLRGHRLVVGVDAPGVEEETFAREPGLLGVGGKSPGHQFHLPVQAHRHPVHVADERVEAATDHACSEFPFHVAVIPLD